MAKTKNATAEVTVDQRNKQRRQADERRSKSEQIDAERRVAPRREKVSRRRQIDPTTCERDYTDDEVAFMQALDEYKRKNGRMFPTCSEVLEVIRGLGYAKMPLGAEVVAEPIAEIGQPLHAVDSQDADDENIAEQE